VYLDTTIILIAMVVAFVLSSIFLKSAEISMIIAASVGILFGVAHGWTSSFSRVFVEGLFTNLDIALLFVTASFFVNFYSESGAITTLTRKLVSKSNNKWVLLSAMAIFMLIPGAITGAGSISVFVLGSMVAMIARAMGLSEKKTAAFVFTFAILSAAAPPVNLWAMMIASGSDMPYVGFTTPLLVPILIVGALSIIYFGWGSKPKDTAEILKNLPDASKDIAWWRIILPPAVLLGVFLVSYYLPFNIPVIGLPLTFVIACIVAIICNPNKLSPKECWNIMDKTMEQIFPLIATVLSVGVLQNAMSATGVKGLIGITFITLPLVWIYISMLFIAPLLQGSLNYGSAVVFGAPLIFLFNTMGYNLTIIASAMSLIFPIGDCLPPSRITGRLSCEVVGYEGSYGSFLKAVLIPCLILAAVALVMMVFPDKFAFLVL
jgi:CitMHS family citrate-Mg2+:H+ or citrate-Ca2+:H+ symporter